MEVKCEAEHVVMGGDKTVTCTWTGGWSPQLRCGKAGDKSRDILFKPRDNLFKSRNILFKPRDNLFKSSNILFKSRAIVIFKSVVNSFNKCYRVMFGKGINHTTAWLCSILISCYY